MTAARRIVRCRDHFMPPGMCVVPGCPHFDGKRDRSEERRSSARRRAVVVRRPAANGRTERVLAKIGSDWAPYPYDGELAERNRDASRISRLVDEGKLERRRGAGGRSEYRRAT